MAQFDLYDNRGDNSDLFPYLLDITHEINTVSQLRVVVPLCSDGHQGAKGSGDANAIVQAGELQNFVASASPDPVPFVPCAKLM